MRKDNAGGIGEFGFVRQGAGDISTRSLVGKPLRGQVAEAGVSRPLAHQVIGNTCGGAKWGRTKVQGVAPGEGGRRRLTRGGSLSS